MSGNAVIDLTNDTSDDDEEQLGNSCAKNRNPASNRSSDKRSRAVNRSSSPDIVIVEQKQQKKQRVEGGVESTRAQMEEERLARVAAGGAGRSTSSAAIIRATTSAARFMSFGQLPTDPLSDDNPRAGPSSSSIVSSNTNRSANASRYWTGSVQRTFNRLDVTHQSSDVMTFADVIGPKAELQRVLITTMVMDPDFVSSHLPASIPILLVLKDSAPFDTPDNVTVHHLKQLVTYGTFHIKSFVLIYKSFIRICITTANAVEYDWNLVENALFIQDFPLTSSPSQSEFSLDLRRLMGKLGAPPLFLAEFDRFDYSASRSTVKLVVTSQGVHVGWPAIKEGGGMCDLARGVASLGLSHGGQWGIEAQGSSMGYLRPVWLSQMLAAASSIHPESYFSKKVAFPPKLPTTNLPIKIVFPTHNEVVASMAGIPGAGTIFCSKKTWHSYEPASRNMFHRAVSKRPGVIAHSKFILGLHKKQLNQPESTDFKYDGFLYVGSHNFTGAAWGTLSHAGVEPKMTNNNWEMGVLIAIRAGSEQEQEKMASELVAYSRPLVNYSKTDLPWCQND